MNITAVVLMPGPISTSPAPDLTIALGSVGIAIDVFALLAALILIAARRRPQRPRRVRQVWQPARATRGIAALVAVAGLGLGATPARAQDVADHLQCFKVTDATRKRLKGVVELDAPSIGATPGCRLSKAKLYCVPTTARVQPGSLLDGNTPLTEVPYHGRPAETDRVCYEVTCPYATTGQTVTDRFGTRTMRLSSTEMVCTPATGGTVPPPENGLSITSPPIQIDPGQNVTYCYYFRTPNDVTLPVKRFVSDVGPAVRSAVLFTTAKSTGEAYDRVPPGTVTAANCDVFADGHDVPRWLFQGDATTTELALPPDDGAGRPVAMEIAPNSSGFLMMHFQNTTAQPVTTHVTVHLEALDTPVYTKTDSFLTYRTTIAVPPFSTGYFTADDCTVPANARFWHWTTRTHKQAARTIVYDGLALLSETNDWTHPAVRTWAPPFFAFASGKASYACSYVNPTSRTLQRGPSQQVDEECMAVGYFLPATRSSTCRDGYVAPY